MRNFDKTFLHWLVHQGLVLSSDFANDCVSATRAATICKLSAGAMKRTPSLREKTEVKETNYAVLKSGCVHNTHQARLQGFESSRMALRRKIKAVLNGRQLSELDYRADSLRFKRCLGCMHGSLRLYQIVPTIRWTGDKTTTITVNG